MRKLASATGGIALLLLSVAGASEPFDIDRYLALASISEIAASPDGAHIAYTHTATDLDADEYVRSVWIQPVAGDRPFRLSGVGHGTWSPQWSADGRYLAVLSDREDDTTQIWLYDRRGGDAQQLTTLAQGIDSFAWAPDSARLLFVAQDPAPADLDEEARPHPRPWVIDRLQFKEDYVGYLDRYRAHIYVIDLEDRSPRQVTFGDYEDSEPAWAPDSRRIAFVSNRSADPDRNRNTDIWVVDSATPGTEPRRLTSADTAEASPAWSPDGRFVVCTSTVADVLPIYAIPRLALIDVESGRLRIFEAIDETQVFAPRYSADGEVILAITEFQGEQNLIRVEPQSGAVNALVEGEDTVEEITADAKGGLFALVSRPGRPGDLFAIEPTGLRALTSINDAALAEVELGSVEKYRYASDDGTELDTFVVFPPGFREDRSYPGLLFIHGGPQAQWDYRFNAEAQLLAARGFVVVMPNPRGSFGYGQSFATAIYRDWGGVDYVDVMAAIDFAIERGWADEDRLAVYGWSYGGMMTNHIITKTDRFDAAITGASATLYVANYGHDQYQRWWEEELGLPWLEENLEHWRRMSPFYSLEKVETPTLIVGGEDDWNVPILNSEQLYIALKRRGIPTKLVVYPDQGHSLSVPSYNRHLYEQYFEWLSVHVDGEAR